MVESSSVCIFISSFNGVNFGVLGDIGKLSFSLFLLAAECEIMFDLITFGFNLLNYTSDHTRELTKS